MTRQCTLGRPLLKRDIEIAYQHARSASAAAKYLGVAYLTFKKYAELYGMFKKNQNGVGIPRPKMRGAAGIKDILEGKRPNYPNKKLRERIFRLGILPKKCNLCGYDQIRMDGRAPLSLYFKDGDIKNKKLDNLEFRCYNCMYITTGKIDTDILHMNPQTFEQDIHWADVQWPMEVPLDLDSIRSEVQNEIEEERSKEENS